MADVRIPSSANARQSGGGCTGLDNPDEQLKCVFSTTTELKVGTGTTAKKQQSILLWYIEQREEDEYSVRKINPQFVPVGDEIIINQEELLSNYVPEVEIHNTRVEPAMCALTKTIAKGDKHRENNKPLSAEMEYTKALDVDETNTRAIFGLGLVYMGRNDREKSRAVFEQLVSMEASFDVKHKHLFNEFGIALRKSKLYDEAVQYYARAVELTAEDDNLYYNLARAFYEKGDWEHCFDFLARALKINTAHEAALSLCSFMVTLADNGALRDKHNKPPVPGGVSQQASKLLGERDDSMDTMVELGPDGVNDS